MRHLRRYPGTFALVETFALLGVASLAIGTLGVTTGRWAGWLSIMWLKPGDAFLSLKYLLFAITALAFIASGVLALSRRAWLGIGACGLACMLALSSGALLAQREGHVWTSQDLSTAMCFFVAPALLCIRRGMRLKHESGSFV
ncbi:MAG TPA: hypothetical protein VGR31_01580 [Planctomycetota bacterium]|jgi:hypothetical protein|nr:hypothetical protein [Planctomycetota bacterium]